MLNYFWKHISIKVNLQGGEELQRERLNSSSWMSECQQSNQGEGWERRPLHLHEHQQSIMVDSTGRMGIVPLTQSHTQTKSL